jgi:2-polyprenyl-3-methyl-5-hydroxy-6-metoxy-1,4-benzoquinol methylase
MKTDYNNYFKKHLGYSYEEKDVSSYRKWFYAQYALIDKKLQIRREDKILEIGSGIGGFYSFLPHDSEYTGIEMDKKAVAFTNKYFKTNKFFNKSLDGLGNKKYDKIFAFEVLEHLENPRESIGKIYKSLNRNGLFCGSSPYPFSKNVFADETHLYVLNPENWKKLFLMNGFKKVELYPMSFFPIVWRVNKRFNIRIPVYLPFYGFISTCLIIARK